MFIEAFEKNIKLNGAKAMKCDSTKLDPTVFNALRDINTIPRVGKVLAKEDSDNLTTWRMVIGD